MQARNTGAPGGHAGDVHLGEAEHPGLHNTVLGPGMLGKAFGISTHVMATLLIVMSVCDGMGCDHMSLRKCDATLDRYIAVDTDKWARVVATAASYKSSEFISVPDHDWHNDVFDITEQDVIGLKWAGEYQASAFRSTMWRFLQAPAIYSWWR